jgi:hypothetical protein
MMPTTDFDATGLIVSVVIGLVGCALFLYGKRQQRPAPIVVALALMIFPYFVTSIPLMVAIALGLLGLMVLAGRFGL